MEPVQKPDRTVVQIELFVMQIMHSCLSTQEIVSTMHSRGIEQLIAHKQPKGNDMALEQLWRKSYRQHIRAYLFQRMGILSRKSYGGRELVVAFVNSDIKVRVMKESMGVVKEGFTHQDAKHKVLSHDRECWQGRQHLV